MKRYLITFICMFLALITIVASTDPNHPVLSQSEPRLSYPGAGRFELTSYFDHTSPGYSLDQNITIYITEVGLDDNGCGSCLLGTNVCGYYTESWCEGSS